MRPWGKICVLRFRSVTRKKKTPNGTRLSAVALTLALLAAALVCHWLIDGAKIKKVVDASRALNLVLSVILIEIRAELFDGDNVAIDWEKLLIRDLNFVMPIAFKWELCQGRRCRFDRGGTWYPRVASHDTAGDRWRAATTLSWAWSSRSSPESAGGHRQVNTRQLTASAREMYAVCEHKLLS